MPPAWPDPDAEKPEGANEDAPIGRDMEDLDWKLNKYGELLPEIMDLMECELVGRTSTCGPVLRPFAPRARALGRRRSSR